MKQTAVEWLIEQMTQRDFIAIPKPEWIQQAKQLEKQQIIQAHEDAYMDCGFEYSASDCANNYYKERYDKI